MGKLSQDDITKVKAMGFLWNRGTDKFSGRVLPKNSAMVQQQ